MVCSQKEGIEMVLGLSGLQQVPTEQRSDRAGNTLCHRQGSVRLKPLSEVLGAQELPLLLLVLSPCSLCDVANWEGGGIFGQLLAWSVLKHLAPVWRAAPQPGAVAACPPLLQRLCLSLGWQMA